jgi:hypothetical protein
MATNDKPNQLKLTNVRLAFPQLFEAKTVNGEGKPAFSANFIINSKDPQIKAIDALIERVAKEKWGAKAEAQLKSLRATDKLCLHNGDTKSQYSGYEGNFFVSARNSVRPLVVDSDKTTLTTEDGRPYSGCYVNAVLELYCQDNSFGKRINAVLSGVQFFKDGEAFAGGRSASVDDFEDITEGVTADDLA